MKLYEFMTDTSKAQGGAGKKQRRGGSVVEIKITQRCGILPVILQIEKTFINARVERCQMMEINIASSLAEDFGEEKPSKWQFHQHILVNRFPYVMPKGEGSAQFRSTFPC